ncbi:PAS domain-containing protein [Halobacillus shinanisalinarum]|uniref:PAS domain-containing protein n=1 Tax=Halobacillus shinanisalinarum TaxID=2932258 RepID=A0ABY4H1E9_9BACI|nr:PAS domain-containing protein [Halobacillus shinanisalinarum]UOQ94256.1 PAS domain-containing protein [Halobacillus shinanisalinarum]
MIFDHAIRTADMMVNMFGPRCEVVVHDFSDLQRSLIHIAGNVTSREIGSPITDLVLNELRKNHEDIKDIPGYRTQSSKGQIMKSTTVFLRDEDNKIIGALCTNYDISLLMEMGGEIEHFIDFQEDKQTKHISETFFKSVHDVIQDMVDQVISRYNKAPIQMTMEEKVHCVGELDEKGTFLIKGATEYVAHVLGVSKFTVYNYLNKVRSMNEYKVNENENVR